MSEPISRDRRGPLGGQQNASLNRTASTTSRNRSPIGMPRPVQANFARPFNRQSPVNMSRSQSPMAQPTSENSLKPPNLLHEDVYQQPRAMSSQEIFSKSVNEKAFASDSQQQTTIFDFGSIHQLVTTSAHDSQRSEAACPSRTASKLSQGPIPVFRQTSPSRNGRPVFKAIKRTDSTSNSLSRRESDIFPASTREETIKALSAAISAGFNSPSPSPLPVPVQQASVNPAARLRVPFSDSPSSVYTADEVQDLNGPGPDVVNTDHERPPTSGQRSEHLASQRRSPLPERSLSIQSDNPLLGLGIAQQQSMNIRPPLDKRSSRFEIASSRDSGSRSSITSLPDLIRRATRLASNLDRGKTASRLGLEWMYASNEKASPKGDNRESSYSEVLSAFPTPAPNTPPVRQQQLSVSERHAGEKGEVHSPSRSRRRRDVEKQERRQCCGLSITSFIIVAVVLVLLIAAAVLIPVFLILVPRQREAASGLKHCPTTHACQNSGISIIDNNACSCVCVDGFTGNQCGIAADPSCITADLREGTFVYTNATLGSDLLPVLSNSSSEFNIPLNISVLLSIFSQNNLSCSGENSLISFGNSSSQRMKRSLVMFLNDQSEPSFTNIPSKEHILQPRRPDVATSTTVSTQTTLSSIPTQSSSAPLSVSSATNLTSYQRTFAQAVVLYILTESRTANTAVAAQQSIDRYLRSGELSTSNTALEVVSDEIGRGVSNLGNGKVSANFKTGAIILGNGTVVGGSLGSG